MQKDKYTKDDHLCLIYLDIKGKHRCLKVKNPVDGHSKETYFDIKFFKFFEETQQLAISYKIENDRNKEILTGTTFPKDFLKLSPEPST